MPQLLLEIFSEEIPARMQAGAARDLERMTAERLKAADLTFERLETFAGPRRLTLRAEGLPAGQADRTEERKGPRVGAPEAAIEGFLRSAGVARDQLVERDGVWFASLHRQGRATAEVIAEIVPDVMRQFPWPKSMTWGSGALRWVRPLQRVACLFDGKVVPFTVDGVPSGDLVEGHRFMGSKQPIRIRTFDDYAAALKTNFVMLDAIERKARILAGARRLASSKGLELVEDDGLLEEVAGLAEWPVPLLGHMDPAFLDLPAEVIRTSMRTHQKYFAVSDPARGGLAPNFIVVANIEAKDGGALVAAGNTRVLSARLNDARFFWDEDRKVPLATRLERLKGVTFHAKLGTMYERVERIEALARQIAPLVGADPELAAQAARLAKADLATGMVGEFPELQGVMGRYYALEEGIAPDIADAIRDHYKPQGPSDEVPTAPVSVAVGLADKFDTLAGFFAINEKPTGSRDPYALRRAALGIIRIVLANHTRLSVRKVAILALAGQTVGKTSARRDDLPPAAPPGALVQIEVNKLGEMTVQVFETAPDDLLAFFADRLKVLLRDEGKRHDLVDAVFALGDDDLVRIAARVDALENFLAAEDGANLLAGYKRATNILKAEEKKGEPMPTGAPARMGNAPPEETVLVNALSSIAPRVEAALAKEDLTVAMRALAALRAPVDGFFDKVLVNDPDAATRQNRLRLLIEVRDLMSQVADFSLVAG